MVLVSRGYKDNGSKGGTESSLDGGTDKREEKTTETLGFLDQ